MTDLNPTDDGMCIVCGADRERGLTCESCRTWLPIALAGLPALVEQVRAELIPADHGDGRSKDPVAARLAAGPAPSLAPDIIVTGGDGEAPVPLDLHLHDLLAGVIRDGGRPIDATGDNWVQALTTTPRLVVVGDGHRGHRQVVVLDRTPRVDANGYRVMVPAGDQVGVVSVAQVLDQEVRAVIDAGAPGSRWRPTPTVVGLTEWLARRADWICDRYAGVDQLFAAVRQVRGQLMGVLGEFDPEPELCDGVACNRCDLRMLFRRDDGSGAVDCQNPDCRKVFTAADYLALVRGAGADERERLGPDGVAAVLRADLPRSADLQRR